MKIQYVIKELVNDNGKEVTRVKTAKPEDVIPYMKREASYIERYAKRVLKTPLANCSGKTDLILLHLEFPYQIYVEASQ